MKVLVTGATGYVGQRLAHRLADGGATVHALVRSPEKAKALAHERIAVFPGDIMDPASLARAAGGCGGAYHAAALVSVWAKDPGDYARVNVGGTLNVLDAARDAGIARVVITSTAGVFGPSDGDLVDEATPRRLPFFNEYESSKAEMHAAARTHGMDAVIVCPTRIYGPGPLVEGNAATKMIARYVAGRWRALPGDGNRSGNYVYVDDVIDGQLAAMRHGGAGEAYILGGENATYRQLFATLAEVSGIRHRLFPTPIALLMAFARLEQFRADRFGRKPLITPSWVRRYSHDWANASAKAERALGYAPRSLHEGLAETVAWLRTSGVVPAAA